MILKLNCKVESDFYNYQQIWGNKTDGSFRNFDNLIINGLRFSHKFNLQRDSNFPLADLFETIDEELAQNRYVLVSLVSGQNMWLFMSSVRNCQTESLKPIVKSMITP